MKQSNFKKYLAVFSLGTIASSMYLLPYVKYVFYDALLIGLDATNEQLGLLLSVYAVVCALGYIPGGWVADRFSAKKIIIISAIATGVLNIILAFVMNFQMALIIWGLLGFSTSFAYWGASIKAVRMLGDSTEQGRLYGVFQGSEGVMQTVSAFIAAGIFTYFASEVIGLKYTLIFYGIMCFISAALLQFTYDPIDSDEEEEKIRIKDIGTVLKLPQTWLLAFTIFSIYGLYSGATMLTPYVTNVIGISAGVASVIAIFRTYIARAVFCPIGGFVADKTGETSKTILVISAISILIISGFFFIGSSTPNSVVLILIMGSAVTIYMNYGIMFAVSEEAKIPRHLYGTAIGIASVIGYLPDSFMHAVFGRWLDDYGARGYDFIFMSLIGLCVITIMVSLLVIRHKKESLILEAKLEAKLEAE